LCALHLTRGTRYEQDGARLLYITSPRANDFCTLTTLSPSATEDTKVLVDRRSRSFGLIESFSYAYAKPQRTTSRPNHSTLARCRPLQIPVVLLSSMSEPVHLVFYSRDTSSYTASRARSTSARRLPMLALRAAHPLPKVGSRHRLDQDDVPRLGCLVGRGDRRLRGGDNCT